MSASFPSLEPGPPATMDSLLLRLGDPGRHQALLVLLLAANLLPAMFQEAAVPLALRPVAHHCTVPGAADTAAIFRPLDSACLVYSDPTNHTRGVEACPRGATFPPAPGHGRGLVQEWGLVCARAHLAALVPVVYLVGLLVGGLVLGWVADCLGRRPVLLASLYSQCLLALATHLVTRLEVFLVIRGLQGAMVTGLQVSTYPLVLELVGPAWRGVAAATLQVVWTTGLVVVAVVARYITHWRYTQLALHVPTLATLLYIWIVPESTRWLACRGRVQRADTIITSIISYNSLKLDPCSLRLEMEGVSRDLVSRQDARRPPALASLLRAPHLRLQMLALVLAWFTSGLCRASLATSTLLTGDAHLDLALDGGLAVLTALLTGLLTAGFGRRWPLTLLLTLLGLTCLGLTALLLLPTLPALPALTTSLTMLGRALALSSLCILLLLSCELLPTVLRCRGLATCCSAGALGALAAPLLPLLAHHLPPAPLVVQALLALLSALFTSSLPDTSERGLPDTVEEATAPLPPALHASSTSLDVGYGKCPEFVLVDGLIVSKECSGTWEGSQGGDSGRGVTESGEDTSQGGTISTLRSSGRQELLWREGVEHLPKEGAGHLPREGTEHLPTPLAAPWEGGKEAKEAKEAKEGSNGGRREERLLPLFSLSTGSTSSRTNLVSQHCSLDSSVVSGDHSIVYTEGGQALQARPGQAVQATTAREILRRKLLALDSDETRL